MNRPPDRAFAHKGKMWKVATEAWRPGVSPPPIELRPCLRFENGSDVRFLSGTVNLMRIDVNHGSRRRRLECEYQTPVASIHS